MKAICGVERITLKPENDSDRALLYLYYQREGQRITVEFNEYGQVEQGELHEGIELIINFEMITENEK